MNKRRHGLRGTFSIAFVVIDLPRCLERLLAGPQILGPKNGRLSYGEDDPILAIIPKAMRVKTRNDKAVWYCE
jgi:hypothetical protein